MILFIGAIAVSCEKEGPAGPAGTNGTNGTNGNANVKVYGYGEVTLNFANSYTTKYVPDGLTSGLIDSSAIFAYYSNYGQWNMANGYGPTSEYGTVLYTDPEPYIAIYLRNPDATFYSGADVTWDSVRVFIIPAMALKVAKKQNIDFNDYTEVSNYFEAK